MKIREVVILIGLVVSSAPLAFAQEKEGVNSFPFRAIAASSQVVQQLEAINLKFDEAFNKHDATAVGALYIPNAVQVTPVGTLSGREAIEGYAKDLFQRHNPSDRITKISYVYAFGGDLCAIGYLVNTPCAILGRSVRQCISFRQVRSSRRSRTEADRGGRPGTEAQPALPVIVGFGATAGCTCETK